MHWLIVLLCGCRSGTPPGTGEVLPTGTEDTPGDTGSSTTEDSDSAQDTQTDTALDTARDTGPDTGVVLPTGPYGDATLSEAAWTEVWGINPLDAVGTPCRGSGDSDGDGRPDMAVAGWDSSGEAPVAALLFFNAPPPRRLTATDADSTIADTSVSTVACQWLGDVNEDGVDDLALSNVGLDDTGGAVGIFLGPLSTHHGLDSAVATLLGGEADPLLGGTLAAAGDVNGDGAPDLLLGSKLAPNGRSYLVYGPLSGSETLPEDAEVTFTGTGTNVSHPPPLDGGHDLNGDGLDDFIVTNIPTSSAYLVLDQHSGVLNVEAAGIQFTTGISAALLGDHNGDGYGDVAIGDNTRGDTAVYVYNGPFTDTRWPTNADATVKGYDDGVAQEVVGRQVAGPGDLNGDGLADLVTSGAGASRAAWHTYVFVGPVSGALSVDDAYGQFTDSTYSNHQSTYLAGPGDVNGDGLDDLLIGAPFRSPDGINRAGSAILLLGQ